MLVRGVAIRLLAVQVDVENQDPFKFLRDKGVRCGRIGLEGFDLKRAPYERNKPLKQTNLSKLHALALIFNLEEPLLESSD